MVWVQDINDIVKQMRSFYLTIFHSINHVTSQIINVGRLLSSNAEFCLL
jgi:hypothetical protein